MADEPVDLEQTRRIDELTARLERLGSALAASPVVGASVRDLFPAASRAAAEPLAWPTDVSDGQVITAAHINLIASNMRMWPENVDANNKQLLRAARIGIGTLAPVAPLHVYVENAAGVDVITGLLLDRAFDAVGDSMDIVFGGGTAMSGNRTGRISCAAVAGGVGGFIFYAQFGGDGYANEIMRIQGNGVYRLMGLPSANPGAGSKQLWYDPAAGNVVKFAP